MKKRIFIFLFICFLSGQSYAEKFDLGEIVITPTKTPHLLKDAPVPASIATEEDVERINVFEVSDIFENIQGLHVVRYGSTGSQSSVYLRGLYSTHTLVLQDGRPLNLPDVGNPILETINPFNVEKVEVIKGPFSALYGANAVAGVINIIKKEPPKDKSEGLLDFSYGSYQTWKVQGSAGIPVGDSGNTGIRLDGHYLKSDGDRDNSEAEKYALESKFQSESVEGNTFDLNLGYNFNDAGNPGSQPSAVSVNRTPTQLTYGNNEASSLKDSSEEKLWFIDGEWESEPYKVKGYINNRENDFYQWYANFIGDGNRRHTNNQSRRLGVDGQFEVMLAERHLLSVGLSYISDKYENRDNVTSLIFGSTSSTSIDESRDTVGIFMQDEISLESIFLQLGIRYDEPSDFDGQLSPKVAALFDVSEQTRIRASAGQAYRAPTLSELNWPEDAFTKGNPMLEAETSTAFDLGIENEVSEKCLIRVNVFYQKIKDMIQWAPTGSMTAWGTPKWQPDNLNEMKTIGFEAEGLFVFNEHFKADAGYTYTDAEQKNSEIVNSYISAIENVTRDARFIPKHKVDLLLTFSNIAASGANLHLDVHYVDEQKNYYTDYSSMNLLTGAVPTVEKILSSYILVNLKLSQKWDNIEAYTAVNNLLDEDYSTRFGADLHDLDYPMPGINYTIGAKIYF